MKKIIIALAACAMAVSVNAAAFSWRTAIGATGVINQAGGEAIASGTAYLFDVSTVSQAALIDAVLLGGKDVTAYTSLSSATLTAAGKIGKTTFNADIADGTVVNAYMALVMGDTIFISEATSATASSVGTSPFVNLEPSVASAGSAIKFESTASYTGSGWYTQAVPEPTSGLLMLLGMAGLALRRRRA